MLIPARTCGGLSKCSRISLPSIVISTETGKGAAELGIVVGVGKAVGAVGQCRDPGAHLALGIVLQGVADSEHGFGAIFAAQRLHALHAQSVRRHLHPQIGQPLAPDLAFEQDKLTSLCNSTAR
jgi:hypothetical protein